MTYYVNNDTMYALWLISSRQPNVNVYNLILYNEIKIMDMSITKIKISSIECECENISLITIYETKIKIFEEQIKDTNFKSNIIDNNDYSDIIVLKIIGVIDKFILITYANILWLYDYIKEEIVSKQKDPFYDFVSECNKLKPLGIDYYVSDCIKLKINNSIEKSINEKIYDDKKSMDLEIKCIDKIVKAHKLFLMNSNNYFKSILSNNYSDQEIKLDAKSIIVENVIEYIYTDKHNIKSINEMIETYELCDFMDFDKFKIKLGEELYGKYALSKNIDSVKIFNVEELNDLPDSIKTITFDINFNENINGKINKNITEIIFGKAFNQTINDICNVTTVTFAENWNQDLGLLPNTIEEIYCPINYRFKSENYPKNVNVFIYIQKYRKYI